MEVVYLDFAKAYDKVDHHLLLQKLKVLGICDKIGMWIGSFLVKRTQSVKVGESISEPKEKGGLADTLANIYVNDAKVIHPVKLKKIY